MQYYLAVDIGASSGRHMLGSVQNGKIVLEEMYRFENQMQKKNGHWCWDTEGLFKNILQGMKECAKAKKHPHSMGIDTWGVDFSLLDENDERIGDAIAYRDKRNEGMYEQVEKFMPFSELYEKTGIQKLSFNTVYQLMAVKINTPEYLEKAKTLLMTPDYFHFLLTGEKHQEYTMATTGALVNAKEKTWDFELIEKIGYPKHLFKTLSLPGTEVGSLRSEIEKEVGFNCKVVLPATHDTASAYMAVPAKNDETVYISSGTWSLLGTESQLPICTEEARNANFTNEGGYDYRYRFLQNIMGLWMIQSIRRENGKKHSFMQLEEMAKENVHFTSIVDVNEQRFMAPESMQQEVKNACRDTGQQVPETLGELMQCVYISLAACYAKAVKHLKSITGRTIKTINIVGGGCKDGYLNQLTANATGLTVYAGPSEGTVIGNLMAQMIAAKEFESLDEARAALRQSFEIKTVHSTK